LRESAETPTNATLIESELAAPQFTLIEVSAEERRRRGMSLIAGLPLLVLVVFVFLWLLTLPPLPRESEGNSNLQVVQITLPPMIPPRTRIATPRLTPRPPKPAVELPQAKPKVAPPQVAAKLPPRPVSLPKAPPVIHEAFKQPVIKPQVHVGSFSSPTATARVKKNAPVHVGNFSGRPKMAMLKLPRQKIQTGGFGDPNGIPGQAKDNTQMNVARLGSFDRPEGPGSGNGTADQHGAKGLVASAGFGNGIAGSAEGNNAAGNGEVRSAGFAGAESMTHAVPHQELQPQAASYEPVEITEKPDPAYTDEARRLHIQGDVLLRVVFTASSHVRVLSVEHGLGHGLDQAAIRAAEQIQFKPARRDGRAVDTTATLHILFQLAD
jgi:TonB family protein